MRAHVQDGSDAYDARDILCVGGVWGCELLVGSPAYGGLTTLFTHVLRLHHCLPPSLDDKLHVVGCHKALVL